MGILSSCCCCCSVRRGSFISGCYTILYFFAFAVLTGNMAYLEIRAWSSASKMNESGGGEVGDSAGSSPANFSTGPAATSEQMTRDVQIMSRSTRTDSTLEQLPSYIQQGTKFPPSQSPPLSIFVILVDFICELAGFMASIILICGLIQERKKLLIPWMVIVPAHTALDIYTSSDILIAFFESTPTLNEEERRVNEEDSWRTFILLFAVTVTALINIYALLCVYSQYQDYNDGRGTAALEELCRQNEVGRRNFGSCHGGRSGQKGDIWCDEVTYKTQRSSSNFGIPEVSLPKLESGDGSGSGKDDSDKVPAVRFENETSSSSNDTVDTHSKLLPQKRSNGGGSRTGCENLTLPQGKNGCLTQNLMEEQSTTADSIDDM